MLHSVRFRPYNDIPWEYEGSGPCRMCIVHWLQLDRTGTIKFFKVDRVLKMLSSGKKQLSNKSTANSCPLCITMLLGRTFESFRVFRLRSQAPSCNVSADRTLIRPFTKFSIQPRSQQQVIKCFLLHRFCENCRIQFLRPCSAAVLYRARWCIRLTAESHKPKAKISDRSFCVFVFLIF